MVGGFPRGADLAGGAVLDLMGEDARTETHGTRWRPSDRIRILTYRSWGKAAQPEASTVFDSGPYGFSGTSAAFVAALLCGMQATFVLRVAYLRLLVRWRGSR